MKEHTMNEPTKAPGPVPCEYVAVIPHTWGCGDTPQDAVRQVMRRASDEYAQDGMAIFRVPGGRSRPGVRRWEVHPVDGGVSWETQAPCIPPYGLVDEEEHREAVMLALDQAATVAKHILLHCKDPHRGVVELLEDLILSADGGDIDHLIPLPHQKDAVSE
jgi:hypothetical protein